MIELTDEPTDEPTDKPTDKPGNEPGDVEALAGLLSRAMERNGFLHYPEALAGGITNAAEEAAHLPALALSWRHLAAVAAEAGEAASLRAWESVRQAARAELRSGHRAAMVLEGSSATPMDRARFLAVREALAEEWRPRGGIEWTLIDSMAQALAAQSYWLEKLTQRSQNEEAQDLRDRQKLSQEEQAYRWGEWIPERVTTAAAIAEAAGMADRFNRVLLRCLRQLRDLRRYSPVVIQNAGQVNVGGQQVNVSEGVNLSKQEAQAIKVKRAKKRPKRAEPCTDS